MNNIFKKGLSLVAFAFVFVLLGIANVSASDIYVKTTGGSTETIDVDLDNSTIGSLKQIIATSHNVNVMGIKLIFAGQELTDNAKTLTEYGIQRESTIHYTIQDVYTVTFDLNGGREDERYPLLPLEFVADSKFKVPTLPELPEIAYLSDGYYRVAVRPEGKVFDAFEIDGKVYNPGDEIEIKNDTIIKYLWKDVIYIHRIELTIDGPIVGTKIEAEYDDTYGHYDYDTQTNRPIVMVPENDNYLVDNSVTIWATDDYDVFVGDIEKDKKYNAFVYIYGSDEQYNFADDLVVVVNGKEVDSFENYELWVDVLYSIDSVEENNIIEYIVPAEDDIDASIAFTELEGNVYDFTINDILSVTDEQLHEMIELFDNPEITFAALKEEFNKLIEYGNNAANGKGTLLKLYEMYLYNNGVEIHKVDGGFKLKIKITDDMKGYDSYNLIYIADDGTTEDAIELIINGEYLEGTLPHLSMYALVGNKNEVNPNTVDNIMLYILMLILSTIGILVTRLYVKNEI